MPIDERAMMLQCDEQELNLQILKEWLGYGQLGLPMPDRRVLVSVAQAGVEPADHQGLSLAAFPVCVPRRKRPRRDLNPGHHVFVVVLRDRQASTPGCSTRTICFQWPRWGSNPQHP